MASLRADGVGMDNVTGDGLLPPHGVLSFMLAAAAKPREDGNWAAQFVMAALAMGRGVKGGHGHGDTNFGALRSHNSPWHSSSRGAERRPVERKDGPIGNEGIDGPNRKQILASSSHGNAAKICPRSEITKTGRLKVLGRNFRDGSRGRGRTERKSGKNKRQKRKPGLRDDDGDGEPGGKPSLDGITGLASSPMWLEGKGQIQEEVLR